MKKYEALTLVHIVGNVLVPILQLLTHLCMLLHHVSVYDAQRFASPDEVRKL